MIILIVVIVICVVGAVVILWDMKTETRRNNCSSYSRMRMDALNAGDLKKASIYNELIKQDCKEWFLPMVELQKQLKTTQPLTYPRPLA